MTGIFFQIFQNTRLAGCLLQTVKTSNCAKSRIRRRHKKFWKLSRCRFEAMSSGFYETNSTVCRFLSEKLQDALLVRRVSISERFMFIYFPSISSIYFFDHLLSSYIYYILSCTIYYHLPFSIYYLHSTIFWYLLSTAIYSHLPSTISYHLFLCPVYYDFISTY